MPKAETAALVVKRVLPFPAEALFRAFSDPAVMNRWFFAGPGWTADASNDFRIGGAYAIRMRSEKGDVYTQQGIYREIVPGRKLAFTWNSEGVKDSLVTVTFASVKGGTEITLIHEFLTADKRKSHEEGWNGCLDNLALAGSRGLLP